MCSAQHIPHNMIRHHFVHTYHCFAHGRLNTCWSALVDMLRPRRARRCPLDNEVPGPDFDCKLLRLTLTYMKALGALQSSLTGVVGYAIMRLDTMINTANGKSHTCAVGPCLGSMQSEYARKAVKRFTACAKDSLRWVLHTEGDSRAIGRRTRLDRPTETPGIHRGQLRCRSPKSLVGTT